MVTPWVAQVDQGRAGVRVSVDGARAVAARDARSRSPHDGGERGSLRFESNGNAECANAAEVWNWYCYCVLRTGSVPVCVQAMRGASVACGRTKAQFSHSALCVRRNQEEERALAAWTRWTVPAPWPCPCAGLHHHQSRIRPSFRAHSNHIWRMHDHEHVSCMPAARSNEQAGREPSNRAG